MQREIKFRVWDHDLKKFIEDSNFDPMISWDGKVYCYERQKEGGDALVSGIRNITVQQYTGMVDKGGTEIYEVDIIRGLMDFGPAGFHERSAIIHWDIEKGYQWNYWKLFSIRIEGNMFENSELLELI